MMSTDPPLILPAADGPINATLRLPGSKSLTNRALLVAAMARGRSRIDGLLLAEDTELMIGCLRELGVSVDVNPRETTAVISGTGAVWPESKAELHCGNAGTVIRFLTAVCAAANGEFFLDGTPRMRERPIGALVDAMVNLGAAIDYEDRPGYCPLRVHGRGLRGGSIRMRELVSSQFVSAVLLAAPRASRDVMLEIEGPLTSEPYVAMTLAVMEAFGVSVISEAGRRFIVPESQIYQAAQYRVEPDASSASYFFAAAALTGGRMTIEGLGRGSFQGDVGFVRILEQMGCAVESDAHATTVCGPGAPLKGVDVDMNAMPDMVPTLAVVCAFAEGSSRIRNVAHLKIKESDRISAVCNELNRIGVDARAREDGLEIHPGTKAIPALIKTYDDHRMAMSFAVAGLKIPGMKVEGAECVKKSFPNFFEYWLRMSGGGRSKK